MSNKDVRADESAVEAAPGAGLDMQIAAELVERAKADGVSLVGPGGLLQQVTRSVLQAALEAEMTDHLGYERGEAPPPGSGNHRNGSSGLALLRAVRMRPWRASGDTSYGESKSGRHLGWSSSPRAF